MQLSPRERRINWLVENFNLWFPGYPYNADYISPQLEILMKRRGLYAKDSRNLKIKDLLKVAFKRLEQE